MKRILYIVMAAVLATSCQDETTKEDGSLNVVPQALSLEGLSPMSLSKNTENDCLAQKQFIDWFLASHAVEYKVNSSSCLNVLASDKTTSESFDSPIPRCRTAIYCSLLTAEVSNGTNTFEVLMAIGYPEAKDVRGVLVVSDEASFQMLIPGREVSVSYLKYLENQAGSTAIPRMFLTYSEALKQKLIQAE